MGKKCNFDANLSAFNSVDLKKAQKLSKANFFFKCQILSPKAKIFKFYDFFYWFGMFVFDTNTFSEPQGRFYVWGTFIEPHLCWKSKFGSVNLLLCKLQFLPFYGLLSAFMAFYSKQRFFLNDWLQNNPNQWKNNKMLKFGLW